MRQTIIIIIGICFLLTGCTGDTTNQSIKPRSLENNSNLQAHFINVGQADSTLLQFSDSEKEYNILIDAGDFNSNEVIEYLQEQNIQHLDLAIGTHPDADHIGQLDKVIEFVDVYEVWLSGNLSTSKVFQRVLEAIDHYEVDYYEPRAGEEFEIGPLRIEVLYPEKITGNTNEESISMKLSYDEINFIFTGDASKSNEMEMIQAGFDLNAEILHLGHHGSATSTSEDFLNHVNPEVAIYSAGKDNSYGHPDKEVISAVKNRDISLYGTDVDGTIIIHTNGNTFEVETMPSDTDSETQVEEASSCININRASVDELQNIIHIGKDRAKQLIEQRPYVSLNDLEKINGIGEARMADILDEGLACLGG
ncbi:competence protein ComEC [Cytobacillus horneckiae]|uniref:MBL fold metallo-hydrolase n=1 Tax=Cytobacillus horneckiae TaxID=549687 RepID=A0A2N0ZHR0_9BACI|nr:MBL fold metallo-hydrolase [Cytobacillus horneckiae]MBN6886985.1 MBL fold metallo-hydrolase [Cytobacillus horneckiae]MEC1157849.1 helix-hairpin-helix domain-containing protein [Cytobacillus horneckiae]MED2937226.1 helix-hairpin-helix domain-containing protein [Cytobacillus horneckiae]PKG29043.1 MBL fold metallo-hydrolase [Cytobacillus horneckiae]